MAHLPKTLLFRYGIFGLPLAFLGLPLYMHLPKFYADHYGISLALIGSVLLFLRIGDAVVDPLIGALTDRFYKLQRVFLAVSLLVMCACFAALFTTPLLPPIIWFASLTMLLYFSYSVASIIFYASGLHLTNDYSERTRVSSWREGFALVGVLCAAVLPTMLQKHFTAIDAFLYFAAIFSALTFVCWAIFPRITPTGATTENFTNIFSLLKKNVALRWLYAVFFLNALPVAITSTLFLFFVEDVLKLADETGAMLGIYFVAAALSTLIWPLISKKIGKKNTMLIAMMIAIASFIWAFFLGADNAHYFYIICVASGFALGADMVLLPALLADIVGDNKEVASQSFGLWQAISKTSLALAAGISLPLLSFLGYNQQADDSHGSLIWLSVCYAIIPCAIKLVALILLLLSPLDNQRRIS